jgi:hypothetical protein
VASSSTAASSTTTAMETTTTTSTPATSAMEITTTSTPTVRVRRNGFRLLTILIKNKKIKNTSMNSSTTGVEHR